MKDPKFNNNVTNNFEEYKKELFGPYLVKSKMKNNVKNWINKGALNLMVGSKLNSKGS